MPDVRINNVDMDVRVAENDSFLTPQLIDRIVQAVLRRLEAQRRSEQIQDQETRVESTSGTSPSGR
jgi:hypothetical protein